MTRIATAISVIKRFLDVDPGKAIEALEALSAEETAGIIKLLPSTTASRCLEHMQPDAAAPVLESLMPEPAVSLVSRMSSSRAADIFRHLSEENRKKAITALDTRFAREVLEILSYPPNSAGHLMQSDLLSFRSEMKVRDVIHRLRSLARKQVPATYCYVTGPEHRLIGVLNMRDLILASPEATVESIMKTEMVKVSPFAIREELISIFGEKHYMAIPVVDEIGTLLGVVNTENLIESTEQEATEDLQMLFGASAEERVHSPLLFKVKKRLPWLHINLVTAFLAAGVIALFEDTIARIAVLAVFLPIVAGQGGNAGIQSLAVVLRGLIMRETTPAESTKLIMAELRLGLINGFVIGLVTALAAWLWRGNAWLGLVIGIAMIVNMVTAGLAGAMIPVVMKRLGFDPAHSSGIFLTTVTDIVGFFAFLGLAWLFQARLI
ncbi:MAG: magnesium transporter [bacterium]